MSTSEITISLSDSWNIIVRDKRDRHDSYRHSDCGVAEEDVWQLDHLYHSSVAGVEQLAHVHVLVHGSSSPDERE